LSPEGPGHPVSLNRLKTTLEKLSCFRGIFGYCQRDGFDGWLAFFDKGFLFSDRGCDTLFHATRASL